MIQDVFENILITRFLLRPDVARKYNQGKLTIGPRVILRWKHVEPYVGEVKR